MPKFMIAGSLSAEGIKGLQKDTAAGREAAITTACASLGGKLEAIYFALGQDDFLLVVDLPSQIQVTALTVRSGASGMFSAVRTVPLMTVAEMDQALAETANYRPPGG
jgi:uncharacterized protein with GYD domain